ncbi:hypothetical protein EDB84DRAFT_1509657 [Lactarius hengduanensis]|nr:hypothetical protein EDB84DRAFT_1509657 [Lactarius hengduanensis]
MRHAHPTLRALIILCCSRPPLAPCDAHLQWYDRPPISRCLNTSLFFVFDTFRQLWHWSQNTRTTNYDYKPPVRPSVSISSSSPGP